MRLKEVFFSSVPAYAVQILRLSVWLVLLTVIFAPLDGLDTGDTAEAGMGIQGDGL